MYFVGIDWADQHHDICVLAADGRILSHFVIDHNLSGFERLEQLLTSLQEVAVNIERPNGLLVEWLLGRGWVVYFTPPTYVAKSRPRRSKSDAYDAYLLANLLRQASPECRLVRCSSPLAEHLSQLVSLHDHLAQERRRLTNRLGYILKQFYPAALTLFRRLDQPLTLAFLARFPTPTLARQATIDDLFAFFRSQRYRYLERVPAHYQRLQAAAPTVRVEVGWRANVETLVILLQTLDKQQSQVAEQVRTVFMSHPDANWWLSFPGLSWLNGARLLARMGDDRQRFPSADMLRAVAGTVPITRRSGKRLEVHFRQECSRPLRKAMTDMARNSVKHSGWAASYYQEQLARGHSKPRGQRALANRWVGIIWKLWQTGEKYQETVHVLNRARQGLPEARIA